MQKFSKGKAGLEGYCSAVGNAYVLGTKSFSTARNSGWRMLAADGTGLETLTHAWGPSHCVTEPSHTRTDTGT